MKTVGDVPLDDAAQTTNFIPYARLAVIKDWDKHHAEFGAYALSADNVFLNVGPTAGLSSCVIDTALDATYQFIFDPAKVTSDMISAHATYIHENSNMQSSIAQALTGDALNHSLDAMRFDVSYSFAATITPSIQYFRTSGTSDINCWGTVNGLRAVWKTGFAFPQFQFAAGRPIRELFHFRWHIGERAGLTTISF